MKELFYHETDEGQRYCSLDSIPTNHQHDFYNWMRDNEHPSIMTGRTEVFSVEYVEEFLNLKGFYPEVKPDNQDHVIRDIVQGKSGLEVMD